MPLCSHRDSTLTQRCQRKKEKKNISVDILIDWLSLSVCYILFKNNKQVIMEARDFQISSEKACQENCRTCPGSFRELDMIERKKRRRKSYSEWMCQETANVGQASFLGLAHLHNQVKGLPDGTAVILIPQSRYGFWPRLGHGVSMVAYFQPKVIHRAVVVKTKMERGKQRTTTCMFQKLFSDSSLSLKMWTNAIFIV